MRTPMHWLTLVTTARHLHRGYRGVQNNFEYDLSVNILCAIRCNKPGAPALNCAGQEDLFGVVRDIWAYAVDDTTEVAVRCPRDLRSAHCRPDVAKDVCNGRVKELSAELVEFVVIGMAFVR